MTRSRLVQLLGAAAALLLPLLVARMIKPEMQVPPPAVERVALVVYDAREVENPGEWWGDSALATPLRRLGYTVRQVAADDIRPDRDVADAYLLCFTGAKVSGARRLLPVLTAARERGAKVILIGNPLAPTGELGESYNDYNRLLNLAGVEDRGGWTADTAGIGITVRADYFNRNFTSAEIAAQLGDFRRLFPVSDRAVPLVDARLAGHRFTPVVLTPEGGVVYHRFLFGLKEGKWVPLLDLPAFLVEALQPEPPDRVRPGSLPTGEVRLDRKILVLFSTHEQIARNNIFRRFLQLPLNWLGYDFDYLDVEGLAEVRPLRDYRIILTAFWSPNLANYEAVLKFLVESAADKYLFIGNIPVYDDEGECPNWPLVVSFFQKFQVKFDGYARYDGQLRLEASPALYPFETSLSTTRESAIGKLIPLYEHTPIFSFRGARVLYTPGFYDARAFFLIGDLLYSNVDDRQYLDLFEGFRRFLKPVAVPLWHTGFGPRLFFSHVDGDGLTNTDASDPDAIGGERILELARSRNLPLSCSFILGELIPGMRGRGYTLELARRFAALPNVEAASHTTNHPLHWSSLPKKGTTPAEEHESETYMESGHSALNALPDSRLEIAGSVAELARLFPGAPPLLFWSGDCLPSEAQLRLARTAGILAINGGDTQFDREHPGYASVAPPYTRVGREAQVYTGAANEMPFTNLWEGPYDGFAKVIETLENTGRNRVVAPANIYYHYYSGTMPQALEALKRVFAWTDGKDLSPVFTSEYIRIVHDFIGVEFVRSGYEIRIRNDGALRAVRFDKAAAPAPFLDYDRSTGLLGFAESADSWEVYLEATGTHAVRFAGQPVPAGLHIRRATHGVTVTADADGARIYRFRGFGPFRVGFAGSDVGARRFEWYGEGVPWQAKTFAPGDEAEIRAEIRGALVVLVSAPGEPRPPAPGSRPPLEPLRPN